METELARVIAAFEFALAGLGSVVERHIPGAMDEWQETMERDTFRAELRRLHATAPDPTTALVAREALGMTTRVRALVKAHSSVAPAKRRKGR